MWPWHSQLPLSMHEPSPPRTLCMNCPTLNPPRPPPSLVSYARLRGIRVVAEWDSPDHAAAWARLLPGLATSCPLQGQTGPVDPTRVRGALRVSVSRMYNSTMYPKQEVYISAISRAYVQQQRRHFTWCRPEHSCTRQGVSARLERYETASRRAGQVIPTYVFVADAVPDVGIRRLVQVQANILTLLQTQS